MIIRPPTIVKPRSQVIDPSVVIHNCNRLGLPVPVGLWAFTEGAGSTAHNFVNPKILKGTIGGPEWGPNGLVCDGGASDRVTIPSSALFDSTTGAIFCAVKTSASGLHQALIGRVNSASSTRGIFLFIHSAGVFNLTAKAGGNTVNIQGVGHNALDGKIHAALGNWSQGSGESNELFVDGRSAGTANCSAAWTFNNQDVLFCDCLDTFWDSFVGEFFCSAWFDRQLTATQAKILTSNPFCLIEPVSRPRSFVAASGFEYTGDITATLIPESTYETEGIIYKTDFSEYATGSPPADWTERWTVADAAYSVLADGDIGGKILAADVTANGFPAISWDDVDSIADVEMLVCFRRKGTSTGVESNNFIVRGVGVTPLHGYFLELQTISGNPTLKLGRCVTGSYTQIGSTVNLGSGVYAGANNWNWVRFQCRGTALKAKLWDASTAEPALWQIEEIDSNITAAGWSGVGHGNASAYDYDIDYFALGSGAASPAVVRFYTGDITIILSPESSYESIADYEYTGDITITLSPESLYETITNFEYTGDITITLSPESLYETITNFEYIGDITITLSPESTYATGIMLAADPIEVTLTQRGILSRWPARERDPALDQTFDCRGRDKLGNQNQGIVVFTVGLEGAWLNQTLFADPIEVGVTQHGGWVDCLLLISDPIIITIKFKSADVLLERVKANWVKWSDIGHLDFTIGKDNVAGRRPLDWYGWVYAIKKLGSKVIVYGENGVSALTPSGNVYGLNTIYRVGLKSKHAVAGDESTHYFIDSKGQLWSLSEGLAKLDYSEYLAALDNPVLSWDVENRLLYISDGMLGYVYSPDSGSLGGGPINVTGVGSKGGDLYVASPATIVTPTFQIVTDVYDFGTRKNKTIQSIEVATDMTGTLSAAIDYRIDKAIAFATTDWHVVDPRGLAFIPVGGREFRFRVKADAWEYFEIDSITIAGEVNAH